MDTVFARGFAAHRDGRLTDAERDYQAALAAEPHHVDALHYLGVLRHQQGQHAEAAELVRRAVDLRPTDAGLQLNLGNALKALGRIDDAIERFRNALTLAPGFPLAQYNLGNAYTAAGRHEDAADAFEKALRLQPDDPAAWNNFGNALSALRRFKDAAHAFKRALALRPRHAGAHNNLGMALNALGDTHGAIEHFRAALEAEPNYVAAHFNLGNLLDANGNPEDALPVLRKAVDLQPHFAPGHFGLGHALARLGRHEQAVPHFERAVGLDPNYGVAWLSLGNAHLARGAHQAALRAFDQALRLDPRMPAAHLNRALALLTTGDYARGLPAYEWRLQTSGSEPTPTLPRWTGEPMPGRTLLVRAEQGFGDTLQFIRFVPFAAKRVGKLVLEVQPALVPLLAPAAHAARVELKSKADDLTTQADAFCPLLSLPLALGITSPDALPARAPYLVVPADYRRKWRGSLGGQHKRKIGIAWSGRVQPGETRSAPVEALAPLFALEGIDWIVLQPFLTGRERDVLRAHPNARSIHCLEGRLDNFADTGAIVDRLDAVVSVDTSVAHLAGALGKPVWVMLPFAADWRWGVDAAGSAWYPGARLVRQRAPGEWREVIEQTAAELRT
ncbi:tetratricopeptide repeat protein [Caballeronia ptereochthonis]|uniref:TPR domain-containing protein n=1 Tax=Caballeronia ptereochthonis TaxID=1777144 RepID=A0A158DWN6_9BURK|nr:tetratricopeptide repeat protein [Caballeronia ptereochthonis]SAK99049.1 TPR domain-containing protein [Caballeronia ptereochthonis]